VLEPACYLGVIQFPGATMADDRSHILAAYLDRGYLNADVQSTVTRHQDDPHNVDVTYNITEHQQVRVSEVVTLGEKVIRKSLIGKVANIYSESPLSQGRLLAGESELTTWACSTGRTLAHVSQFLTRLMRKP
jgi:outer membrane protein assembly factor BamA